VGGDLKKIFWVQALRAFIYGFGSVIMGSALAAGGLSEARVGFVFAAMLVGMALSSVAVGRWGERVGRRRLYRSLLVVVGVAGAAFALTTNRAVLVAAALTGTLSTDPNESGPITSLEQAMMGQAPAALRSRVFGRYNAVAYLAGSVGALAAGGPQALRSYIPALPADQRWLLAFPVVAAACIAVASRLSPEVEVTGAGLSSRPLHQSAGIVRRLAALFAIDAGAGGFVTQAFIVFWFRRRFGAGTDVMGLVFFAAGILQAASSIAAGRLANRIGYLNTMVFTHLPSNFLLMAVAFMPNLNWAIAVLLIRFALSQMDVPARQAYITALVLPEERIAAAAYTNTARYVARPVGPAAGGLLMQRVAVGAPFVVAGAVKAVYDLALWLRFRRVELPAP
jgi:predicted MFS family arabinose efflux permease